MKYQAVIFDLDGTILNTLDDLADSANHVLAAKGFPVHPTDRYKTFVGNGIPKLIERMLPSGTSEQVIAETLADFQAYYALHKNDKTAPYPGISELLKAFRARGVKLCVLSNKQHDLSVAIVRHHFGDGTFDLIQGQSDRFPAKPDPASCFFIMEQLGIPAQSILYVGDSNVDMQTARNAGLTACGVSWGFRSVEELTREGADYIAVQPSEIFSLMAGEAQ